MITVKEYRGHIRNWEELCERLGIDLSLSREEREKEILIKAYQTWGYEMADHMYGMFAFALWDDEEKKLFCLRDQFGTKPFYYYETEDGQLLTNYDDPSNDDEYIGTVVTGNRILLATRNKEQQKTGTYSHEFLSGKVEKK